MYIYISFVIHGSFKSSFSKTKFLSYNHIIHSECSYKYKGCSKLFISGSQSLIIGKYAWTGTLWKVFLRICI